MKEEEKNNVETEGVKKYTRQKVGIFGVIGDFIRDFGATFAAIAVLAALAVLFFVFGVGNDSAAEDTAEEVQYYSFSPEKLVLDTDLVTVTDDELRSRAAIPTCSRYDNEGRPVAVVERDDAGEVTKVSYYEYRDDGTTLTEKTFAPSGAITEKTVFASLEIDCVKASFTFEYDDAGNLKGYSLSDTDLSGTVIKKTEYAPTGVLKSYSRFEYSGGGEASRETVYSPYDAVVCYYEYSYDEAGRVTDQIRYEPNSDSYTGTSWVYDVLDRVVRESFYNGDVCYAYNEYAYNEDGTFTMAAYYLTDQDSMTYEKKIMST
ncbi:MAG: hypothetical protein IKN38_05500 [Clostridia bacterium]|nr:hypothetical protein [Clostridia bacterium]